MPDVTNWNRWSGPEFHIAFNGPLADANMTIHLVTRCRKRKSGAQAQTSVDDSARATSEVSYVTAIGATPRMKGQMQTCDTRTPLLRLAFCLNDARLT